MTDYPTEGPFRARIEGAVLEVTLDRPKANAIDLVTSRIMGQVFRAFRDDDRLRVAILRAEGDKFFCPGWDLARRWMATMAWAGSGACRNCRT